LVETKWGAQQLFLSDAHVMYPSLHFKKLNGRDNQKKKKKQRAEAFQWMKDKILPGNVGCYLTDKVKCGSDDSRCHGTPTIQAYSYMCVFCIQGIFINAN
jgi:hypothetical protein